MPKPKLIFYLDLHSTFSYLAYYYIRHSDVFKDCDITYVPVIIIAFVKNGVSNAPWGNINKEKYSDNDIARWARLMDIPWRPGHPDGFPLTRTSDVQRAVTACTIICPEKIGEVYDALFHAFWVEKKGCQRAEVYEPILRSVLGEEMAPEVIDMVQAIQKTEEVRSQLYKSTEQAMGEGGACGLPWFTAYNSDGERDDFWGFDHLGLVARHLGIKKLPGPHL